MLRHFVSNFQSLLRQQASQVAVPFSGHHPLLLLSFSLFRQIWTTVAGYKELAVRFVPIEKGIIF